MLLSYSLTSCHTLKISIPFKFPFISISYCFIALIYLYRVVGTPANTLSYSETPHLKAVFPKAEEFTN